MNRKISLVRFFPLILLATPLGCGRGDVGEAYGEAAAASAATPELTSFEAFDSDVECLGSGVRFSSGVDRNSDGTLDTDEITQTEVICDEAGGSANQLVRITAVEPGFECESGGLAVHQGSDTNLNGQLDDVEILDTEIVCTGWENSVRGAYLSRTDPAAIVTCPMGGTQFSFGEDVDRNGFLDDFEIQSRSNVCNASAACSPLIQTQPVAAGGTCSEGGTRMSVGQDDGGFFQVAGLACDGLLDDSEIDDQVTLCNGEQGTVGLTSLVEVRDAPDGRCLGEGFELLVGIDDDRDGALSDAEVDQTELLCPGGVNFMLETGIRTDRSLSDLRSEGWTVCYERFYNEEGADVGGSGIKAACQAAGEYLMVGCTEHTADVDRLVVSAADRAAVVLPIVDDLAGGTNHRIGDGNVGWYFTTTDSSIGFFEAGDGLRRHSADTFGGVFPERRLSWHTHNYVGGFRCGARTSLNNNSNWKKYILAHF